MVYLHGQRISGTIFNNIVDAIYYGGLYQKIKFDRNFALVNNSEFKASDRWPVDLMLSVLQILINSIGAHELKDLSIHIERFALFVAVFAIIVAFLISVFSK